MLGTRWAWISPVYVYRHVIDSQTAMSASIIATSTNWPSPVARAWCSAASTPATIIVAGYRSPIDGPQATCSPPFGAGVGDHPAHRLGDHVVGRPRRVRAGTGARVAEAADRAVHQLRVGLAQHLVAESQRLHHAGAEVLDDDVGRVDQATQDRRVGRVLQVERDAALVAVARLAK